VVYLERKMNKLFYYFVQSYQMLVEMKFKSWSGCPTAADPVQSGSATRVGSGANITMIGHRSWSL